MIVLVTFLVPCLLAQTFCPRHPVLEAPLRAKGLVAAAVAVQLAANAQPELARLLVPAAFLLGTLAITWILWVSSRSRWVAGLAGAGAVANLIPIARYGAMPVRRSSREMVSPNELHESAIIAAKHVDMDVTLSLVDPLQFLTDWIPLPFLDAVISIGDVLIVAAFVGLGLAVRRRLVDQPAPNAAKRATSGLLAIS